MQPQLIFMSDIPLESHRAWPSKGILNIEMQLQMNTLPSSQAMDIETWGVSAGFVMGVTSVTHTYTHAGFLYPCWCLGLLNQVFGQGHVDASWLKSYLWEGVWHYFVDSDQ